MRIQHNITAMNANRQLNITGGTLAKSARNLSSGYKINVAADDAAGLSISEKMRRQIRGLTKAGENVEDGISLCQVADGAMAEMHDMTNRVNELCVQAANGTNSATDRSYIQMEIDGIVKEMDRIINATKFNEVYIFRGDGINSYTYTVGNSGQVSMGGGIGDVDGISVYSGTKLDDFVPNNFNETDWVTTTAISHYGGKIQAGTRCAWVDFSNLTAGSKSEFINKLAGYGFDSSCNRCEKVFYGVKFVAGGDNNEVTSSGIPYNYHSSPETIPMPVPVGIVSEVLKIDLGDIWDRYTASGETRSLGEMICSTLIEVLDDAGGPANTFSTPQQKHFNSCLTQHFTGYTYEKGTGKLFIALIPYSGTPGLSTFNAVPRNDQGQLETMRPTKKTTLSIMPKEQLSIHAGTDADGVNKVIIRLPTMTKESLWLDRVSVLTEKLADESLNILNDTLRLLSEDRSRIGAYQNRLEHTGLNLDNVVENTTASESQIRDTDMATEMVQYSNKNILRQASQAMLTQANQSKQGILSLLSA